MDTFSAALQPGNQLDNEALANAIQAAKVYAFGQNIGSADTVVGSSNPVLAPGEASKQPIKVSANGEDVSKTMQYVHSENMTALTSAITAAQGVYASPSGADAAAKQAAINTATATLNAAVAEFEKALQYGQQNTDYTILKNAIKAANDAKAGVIEAEAGNTVAKSNKWANNAAFTALNCVLTPSETMVNGDTANTQELIDNQAALLNAATQTFLSKVKPGTKDVDYATLEQAIEQAKAAMQGLMVDTTNAKTPAEVVKDRRFVTQTSWETMLSPYPEPVGGYTGGAIYTAQQMIDTDSAVNQQEVYEAAKTLMDATQTFVKSIKVGTKNMTYAPLEAAITTAQSALDAAITSLDGTDVYPSQQWTTPYAKKILQNAIDAAQAMIDNDTAADQDAVKTAVDALNAALEKFQLALKNGTMVDPKLVTIVNDNAPIAVGSQYITGITGQSQGVNGIDAATLAAQFTAPQGYTVKVVPTGKEEKGLVGTGAQVQLLDSAGKVIDSKTVIITADLNGNGIIDIGDASLLTQQLLNRRTLTTNEALASDINGTGRPDIGDMTLMAKTLLAATAA